MTPEKKINIPGKNTVLRRMENCKEDLRSSLIRLKELQDELPEAQMRENSVNMELQIFINRQRYSIQNNWGGVLLNPMTNNPDPAFAQLAVDDEITKTQEYIDLDNKKKVVEGEVMQKQSEYSGLIEYIMALRTLLSTDAAVLGYVEN